MIIYTVLRRGSSLSLSLALWCLGFREGSGRGFSAAILPSVQIRAQNFGGCSA